MFQIIPKAVAKELGMKRYFTGKVCKNGHVAERYVSGGGCLDCVAEGRERWAENNPERKWQAYKEWYAKNKDRVAKNNRQWREANREHKAAVNRRWYEENKERVAAQGKQWREDNKERKAEVARRWYRENRERHLEGNRRRYRENKDRYTETIMRWRNDNREKMAEYKKQWMRDQRRTNPEFRLTQAMYGMVYRCIENKTDRTQHLLGYTAAELRHHIERQFTKGMSWEAHARGEIHIDHIYPIAQFIRDGETDPAVINCLTNLRPMWAEDNVRKRDTVETLL